MVIRALGILAAAVLVVALVELGTREEVKIDFHLSRGWEFGLEEVPYPEPERRWDPRTILAPLP